LELSKAHVSYCYIIAQAGLNVSLSQVLSGLGCQIEQL